ncbi:MAG: hypothetical protein CL605_02030 [Altibacter sp.]|nr:hypothetical protein [Altibacter sp.]
MYSIKLSRYTEEEEEQIDIEYALEELLKEETVEDLATTAPERVKVETNKAYNEAETFIANLENSRETPEETTEEKLQAMNDAIGVANNFNNDDEIAKAKKRIKEAQEKSALEKHKKPRSNSAASRKTTISYSLKNRTALLLPNPVYTCEGFGKVVISIEVNELGRVVKMSYNKSASTTTNECLIDSALEYARDARFTTASGTTKQLGTISYNFPGQQ